MAFHVQDALNISESKGLKRAGPYMRGAANHFGFRRKNASSNNNASNEKAALEERGYSQEELAKEQHMATTAIKASPGLVRGSAANGPAAAARTNRFGFRAPVANNVAGRGLSNKVADSSPQVLAAAHGPAPALAKGPVAAPRPVSSPASAPARPAHGPAASKRPSPPSAGRPAARFAGRPSPPTSLAVTRVGQSARPGGGGAGSLLPRPQFTARAKEAKTAANYGTRGLAPMATFDDEIGSSKESSMNEDSGLGSQLAGDTDTLHGIDILDVSPQQRAGQGQRPRKGGPAPRRSLRDEDDDPNVITEIVPIARMVSRASLRSIASLGGTTSVPSPKQLSAKGSVKSASSDEFHSDSGLFRDYGEGLDDTTEAKVYIDCKTAEKRLPLHGRYMKDYGPGEEQDEDWGQGEAMAENDWREEISHVVIDEEPNIEVKELQCRIEGSNLADLVAAAASAEHGLIEDESAPEDSLFSSSPPSTSEDSPSKHNAPSATARGERRKLRTKKREREREREANKEGSGSAGPTGPAGVTKDSKADKSAAAEKKEVQGPTLSPEGSGTPSNSFSLSDGRDFLIDDEITDQPALMLRGKALGHGDDSEMASLTDSVASATLRESSHHQAMPRALRASEGSPTDHHRSQPSRDNTLRLARFGSLDSLATNSIDSEDLMMDFEEDAESTPSAVKYRSVTKSWGGSPVLFWPRPRKSRSFSFVDLEQLENGVSCPGSRGRSRSLGGPDPDAELRDDDAFGKLDATHATATATDNDSVLLELTSLMASVHKGRSVKARPGPGPGQAPMPGPFQNSSPSGPSSAPDSPRYSLGSSGAPSPLRPPRQLASSDSDESAMMRVDRGTYQHMYQDVVHIKTMLLKLKRVLQEAETLNPFESSLKNGLLHQLVHADESGEDEDRGTRNPEEEVVDLKRQMVLMKQQLEEKDRTIQLMQVQMMKYERVSDDSGENGESTDMCNAATQTERLRPVSAGPSILNSLPADSNGTPLVSWTDTWGRRSRTPASGSINASSSNIENRTPSASRVPTATPRSSRSVIPGHQRLYFKPAGDSPSNIPLVKGNHRKTGTDSVPNSRRPPVVAAPRKVMTSLTQKP